MLSHRIFNPPKGTWLGLTGRARPSMAPQAFVLIAATMFLRLTTTFTLDQILLEVFSAVGTVGLSGGMTPLLPDHGKIVISLLMLFGRLGPIVVATSLALRATKRHFEYPRERPLIG